MSFGLVCTLHVFALFELTVQKARLSFLIDNKVFLASQDSLEVMIRVFRLTSKFEFHFEAISPKMVIFKHVAKGRQGPRGTPGLVEMS